jgi:hypothetical protein
MTRPHEIVLPFSTQVQLRPSKSQSRDGLVLMAILASLRVKLEEHVTSVADVSFKFFFSFLSKGEQEPDAKCVACFRRIQTMLQVRSQRNSVQTAWFANCIACAVSGCLIDAIKARYAANYKGASVRVKLCFTWSGENLVKILLGCGSLWGIFEEELSERTS